MSDAPAIIAYDTVSKSYGDSHTRALDHVSFDVAAGEFLAIVGPSGSGKTTLIGLLTRLIDPTEGTVKFDGEDVRGLDAIALRRRIGYVFQGVGLFPHMTIAENIGITPRLIGWESARINRRVDELLDLVQLTPEQYRDRLPSQLSGGERQRVGVARAIAAEPRVVLMDEPFGSLDPLTRDALGDEYKRLHAALGLTTVMITHDILEALLLADRIAVLNNGRLVELGTSRELMSAPRDPYVRDLMRTPHRHADRLSKLMAGGAT